MTTQEERKKNADFKYKRRAIQLADENAEKLMSDKSKKGVLLCEGTEGSMDYYLYSRVYQEFIVVPVGGCSDVKRLIPFMKRYFEYDCFGIIDRDNCSKNRIRSLRENGIYCTKLPFIENILCCPDIVKIVCSECGKDYLEVLQTVKASFECILAEKMSLLNPFNIDLPRDEEVQIVSVSITTKTKTIHKTIDLNNVMYTFRNKTIVGLVALALDFHGGNAYYRFLKKQIEGEKGEKILQVAMKYLPTIVLKEF